MVSERAKKGTPRNEARAAQRNSRSTGCPARKGGTLWGGDLARPGGVPVLGYIARGARGRMEGVLRASEAPPVIAIAEADGEPAHHARRRRSKQVALAQPEAGAGRIGGRPHHSR